MCEHKHTHPLQERGVSLGCSPMHASHSQVCEGGGRVLYAACLSGLHSPIVTGYLVFMVLEMLVPSPQFAPSVVCLFACMFHPCYHCPVHMQMFGVNMVPAPAQPPAASPSDRDPHQVLTHPLPQDRQETCSSHKVPGPHHVCSVWGLLPLGRGVR